MQKLAELRAALVTDGYDTAAKQAAVLNLSRSTAWKILKGDHKHSGLTAAVINRMLASPDLPLNFHPAAVRASTNVTPFGAVSVPA